MENFKNFLIRNRHLTALTVGVAVFLSMVFSFLGIVFLDNKEAAQAEVETTKKVSENKKDNFNQEETDKPGDIVTIDGEDEPDLGEIETRPSEELPYLIMVNTTLNCVTIYEKDANGQFTVPVKAMVCSTGREGHETPTGTYTTSHQYRWAVMADNTRCQYVYRFKGPYLFHSVPYMSADKNNLEPGEFNKLGSHASLGCVRLCVRDAKWIYENCPVNTKVILYEDATSPGPLGKPEMIKIPENSPYVGWDPTDPDPNNPWLNCSASIVPMYDNLEIKTGATVEHLLEYFYVLDTCGNDVPERAYISGNYNLNIDGEYTITIGMTDALGSTATLEVTVKVSYNAVDKPTKKDKLEEATTKKDTEDKTTVEATTKKQKETKDKNTTNDLNESNHSDNNATTKNDNTANDTTYNNQTSQSTSLQAVTTNDNSSSESSATENDEETSSDEETTTVEASGEDYI